MSNLHHLFVQAQDTARTQPILKTGVALVLWMGGVRDLPPEIWLDIVDRLPPEDIITLSTTCRLLRSIFRDLKSVRFLQTHGRYLDESVRSRFLILAEYDGGKSNKRLCHRCGHWEHIEALNLRNKWSSLSTIWTSSLMASSCCFNLRWNEHQHDKLFMCQGCTSTGKLRFSLAKPWPVHLWCAPWRGRHWNGRYRMLDWEIVQSVVRAQRMGPNFGISLRCLETYLQGLDVEPERIITAKAVVIDARLLLKLSCTWTGSIVTDCSPHCAHYCGVGTERTPLGILLQCLAKHVAVSQELDARPACTTCGTTYRCSLCPSEYAVETVQLEGATRLCLHRWIDLGSGLSPWNEEWRRLTRDIPWAVRGELVPIESGSEMSIRKRFERSFAQGQEQRSGI